MKYPIQDELQDVLKSDPFKAKKKIVKGGKTFIPVMAKIQIVAPLLQPQEHFTSGGLVWISSCPEVAVSTHHLVL